MLSTIIIVCGKVNFTNLSRYSSLSERTYRRQFDQYCNFPSLNAELIATATASHTALAVMDCSFIAKSGQHTDGLDRFYNGSHSRVERGLDVSLLAVVDVQTQTGYARYGAIGAGNLPVLQTALSN